VQVACRYETECNLNGKLWHFCVIDATLPSSRMGHFRLDRLSLARKEPYSHDVYSE
jgi:hypothetical protein